jgi:threonyl-tRNA synthetase
VEPREEFSRPSGWDFLFNLEIRWKMAAGNAVPDHKENYQQSELYRIRHSTAHVMAQAVKEMFPEGEAKIAIGPPIENGFYYDFDLPRTLTPEDLEAIEKRMRQIIAGKHPYEKRVVSADEARRIFADQPYKLELIEGLEQGGFDEYGNPLEEKPEISVSPRTRSPTCAAGPHVEQHGRDQPGGGQAAQHGGCLLARGRNQAHAAARLWHGLEDEG